MLTWFIGNENNTVVQKIGEPKIEKHDLHIYHNGQISTTFNLGKFATKIKTEITDLLNSVQDSEFLSFVSSINITLSYLHINDKGEWSGLIHLTGYGLAYKDFQIKVYLPSVVIIHCIPSDNDYQSNSIYFIVNGRSKPISRTYTEQYTARYDSIWFAKNGHLIKEIYRARSISPDEPFIYKTDTRLTESFQNQLAFLKGNLTGVSTSSERMSLESFFESERDSCFLPIQDDFCVKATGYYDIDFTTIYKKNNVLFSAPSEITQITPINETKKEYLFRCGYTIYTYLNGKISRVTWNNMPITANNWRLRYMSQIQNLRKKEEEIP